MSYIAYTIRKNLVKKLDKARLEPSNNHKMIVMFPSMPEKTLLLISSVLSNHFLQDYTLILTLKIAEVLLKDWSIQGRQKAENNNWIDLRGNLTYYRNMPLVNGKFSLVILFGTDRVTDAASLSDFYTCDPELIWNIEMNNSFRSWVVEKIKDAGLQEYEDEDLLGFDRIMKPILDSGHGDLFQISEWFSNLDIIGVHDIKHMQRLLLGNLQEFGLPIMTSFPLWKKTKNVSFYFNKSKDFFNYSLFLEPQQRDKAIKAIDALFESISNGDIIKIPLEDEEIKGVYKTGAELLYGLKNYITNNDYVDREKLLKCDFIVIWDDILKFRRKVSKDRPETITKISGNPTEVFLTAIWLTLKEYFQVNKSDSEIIIDEISLITDIFKHDVYDGNNIEENSWEAIEYLTRLIGGIDHILSKRVILSNCDGTDIKVTSNLITPNINCRYSKSAEPILEFSVIISNKDAFQRVSRRFGWRLPEHHMYRLSADLLLWAKLGFESLGKDYHILPVYHLSYYEELMQSSADDEIRRILLHSIRDEWDNKGRITNLLAGEWSQQPDSFADLLKSLASKYYEFIKNAVSQGLLSTIFENYTTWVELRRSYIEVFEAFGKLQKLTSSSMLGMLTRCFLIIQPRPLDLDITWHANYYEKSGIITVLHPCIIEMLEAQIAYLTTCFNYAAKKELRSVHISRSFNPNIWQTYVDLSEIQSPLAGLLYNEELNLDANVRGYELIHRIGTPINSEAPLSTRLLLNYHENADDENDLTDIELFRETSESRLLLRLMLDYFDLHPHARDGLNIAVYRNENIQPVIAAVHSFLKYLSKKPSLQLKNRRYVLNKDRKRPYTINVTLFTETNDETDVSMWVQQWKDRWETADTEPKYELYQYCRFSIAHRIIEKNEISSFQRLITENFEADIAVLYDFIGAGEGVNKFENVEEFDITSRELKFPILEKATCTINNPAERYRRKRIISNRQFLFGAFHANLLHSLQSGSIQKGTLVVGAGDFTPWRRFIDFLHKRVDWVICIDPNIDERLIKSQSIDSVKEREIIGFGSGVGTHGEDNFTISTEQYTLVNILNRLKVSIKSLYAQRAGWSLEDCDYVAKEVLKESRKLSGLSLVRATGIGDEYIRDFMAYALSRRLINSNEKTICESLISLDAYRHWFDLSENKSRPDLLWISATLNDDNQLDIKMHLIECKMGIESKEHISKAKGQIDNGLRILIDSFKPSDKKIDNNCIDDYRPDRRYWWMQLHRLIASKTEVDRNEYPKVLSALERMSDGDFKISWQASVYAFWLNDELEIKRMYYWNIMTCPLVIGSIYAIGGSFVKKLMTSDTIINWKQYESQGSELFSEDDLLVSSDEDDANDLSWLDEGSDEENLDSSVISDQTAINDTSNLDSQVTESTSSNIEIISAIDEIIPVKLEGRHNESVKISDFSAESIVGNQILLGKTVKGGQQVYWEFGHKALPNRHMLIFGSSGQGKTYAIQCILCEMIKNRQNSLIIDYTNGFLPNQLEKITIEKLSPKQHVIRHEPLPINPFLPIDSDSGGIRIVENANNVASRISGLFDAVYNIGDQQYSVLHQAIMEGVDSLGSNMNLDEMLNIIEAMTNDKKYKSYAQSLLSKLRPFVLDKPFAHGNKGFDWDSIFLKKDPFCNIFQLASLDMHSCKLITEFILWDLYGHLQAKGKKTDPKVIVLDEVQNLDHKEGNPLSKYLTEGRKFGVSLILATQNISNLNKEERSRMFNAEHKLFFKPSSTEIKAFAEIAAQTTNQKTDEWIIKLASLNKGECFSIGPTIDSTGEKLITRPYRITITSLEERNFDLT